MIDDFTDIRIQRHLKFWNRQPLGRPVVSFRIGDFFFTRRFNAAARLLGPGRVITPDMIDTDTFFEDYERMFSEISTIGQDGFWAAEPFAGLPWMEAMLGCEVRSTDNSFVSSHWAKSPEDIKKTRFDPENPWFKKYMEFVVKLVKLSDGRFPIGQPIMRGPSDVAGAILGQTEMVFAMAEEPEIMKDAVVKIADIFREVISWQYNLVPEFHGGYSMGFYHVWSPGKCIWFQEDLSALLSPAYYRSFLREPDENICKGYDYTAVHLHPTSFFIVDELMKIDALKVIQINKDVGGPDVKQMIPVIKKVLSKKNVVLWGDFDKADIDTMREELPDYGLFLNIVSPTLQKARELMEHINSK